MDVRLSPEQQTLREAVMRLVDRLAPRTVDELENVERVEKLDAAVASTGWRDLRAGSEGGDPWASAVEPSIVAEELARAIADTFVSGADARRGVAPPRWRSGGISVGDCGAGSEP
jgi:hypothetical protein